MKRVHLFKIEHQSKISEISMVYDEKVKEFKMRITNFPDSGICEIIRTLFEFFGECNVSKVLGDFIFDNEEEKCIESLRIKY